MGGGGARVQAKELGRGSLLYRAHSVSQCAWPPARVAGGFRHLYAVGAGAERVRQLGLCGGWDAQVGAAPDLEQARGGG